MTIIIAPDSFKHAMPAIEAAAIISAQFRRVFPQAEVLELPLADGGEGTVAALVFALGGTLIEKRVEGPLGQIVNAKYGLINQKKTAIIEMASASGIELIAAGRYNPLKTSTYGTGELILDALNQGVSEIIVALGGSATVDGGIGMAQALGFRITDGHGCDVGRGGASLIQIAQIDASHVPKALFLCRFRGAADVRNLLCGPQGAAAVFGPQKGADVEMVALLDRGLENLQKVFWQQNMLKDDAAGDGAAGGLGAGLRAFCRAEIESGAELLCRAVGLAKHLKIASLLITGEGKTDAQTLCGKLCQVVSQHARRANVPVLLLSGAITLQDRIELIADYAVSISCGETTHEDLIHNTEQNLAFTALNCAKMLKMKFYLGKT